MEKENKFKTIYTTNALDNLENILSYVEFYYGENFAQKLLFDIDRYIEYLEIFPEMFPKSNYCRHGMTLRKIVVSGYIIFYEVDYDLHEVIIRNIFNELENIEKKY